VAAGYGKAMPVRSVVGGVVSTTLAAFTYDSPVMTYLYRNNMAQNGIATMTIEGTNFGITDISPNLSVGGTSCVKSKWMSGTSLACRPLGGVGVLLEVTAEVKGMMGTMAMAFTYDAPVLTLLTHQNGPTTAGSTVTLVGKNFGTYSGHLPVGSIAGNMCAENTWVSYTSVLCAGSASGTGVQKSVSLTLGETVGTFFGAFTYDAPVPLKLVAPNSPVTGGGIMTVIGGNFADVSMTPSIILGMTACLTSVWTSFSTLRCTLPEGSGKDMISVTTVIDGVIGTVQSVFTYDAPCLTDLYGNSPLSGSGAVTIFGMNFGLNDPSPTLYLNSAECISNVWTTSSSVLCVAPVGSGLQLPISAEAFALYSTALKAMTYDAPVVTAISLTSGTPNGPTTGGAMYTLQGFNFGVTSSVDNSNPLYTVPDIYNGTVGLNSAYSPVSQTVARKWCSSVSWSSDSEIVCTYSSQGGGALQDIGVTADGNSGNLERAWTYDAPVLTGILQPNGPAAGGAALSILGMNFGWKYTDSLGNNYQSSEVPAAIVTTSTDAKCETTMWISDSSVACITPAGIGSVQSVSVDTGCRYAPCFDVSRQAINAGTMQAAFTYDGPVVTFLAMNNGPTGGGAQVTFYGLNFGPNDAVLGARIGRTQCVSSSWLTNTAVTCTTPEGKAGGSQRMPVSITVGTLSGVGTALNAFRYDASINSPPQTVPTSPETIDAIQTENALTFSGPFGRRSRSRRRALNLPSDVTKYWTKYYYQVGDLVNITFTAFAEDEATNVAIATWDGRTAASFTGYEYRMDSKPNGRRATGYFTWSPASTSPVEGFSLCAQLVDSKQVVQDYLCVKIIVLSCQHVVQPGESLQSIASMYKLTARTIWWLNPDLQTRSDASAGSLALNAGRLVKIGRTYTIHTGESLTTLVRNLDSTWYWVNKHNPKKIFFPSTVSMDSMSYKTREDFVGREYCVVADIAPVQKKLST